jgi:hypothetical protein
MNVMARVRAIVRGLATVLKLGFGAAPVRVSVAILGELLGAAFALERVEIRRLHNRS